MLFLSSCTGPDGQAYLKYKWSDELVYFSDTNPSTPSIIYNDTYFSTNPGTYYMEYKASTKGPLYYLRYTITTKKGEFLSPGADSWFVLVLYTNLGPHLYEYDSPKRSIDNNIEAKDPPSSVSITRVNEKISSGKKLSEILGTEEREYPFGTIKIEWGEILED